MVGVRNEWDWITVNRGGRKEKKRM